jgi:hypothetical protein
MDQLLGGLFMVLFLGHFVLLFYSDAKLRRLTNHLNLSWYQYPRRVSWLRENLDQQTGVDRTDAVKALRGRSLSLGCVVAMVGIVVISSMIDR